MELKFYILEILVGIFDNFSEEDRHLQPAEIPNCYVNVLIVESTYGIKLHESR